MARPTLRSALRPIFRRFAQEEREAYAREVEGGQRVEGVRRGRRVAWTEGGGAGSLGQQIRKAKIALRAWGYVVRYADLGQLLTWYVRGTGQRQRRTWRGKALSSPASTGAAPAHPAAPRTNVDGLAAEIQTTAVRVIQDFDNRARA